MKFFLLITIVFFTTLFGQSPCFIYLNNFDVHKIVEGCPTIVVKDTRQTYLDLHDFQVKKIKPQEMTIKLSILLKKWITIKEDLKIGKLVKIKIDKRIELPKVHTKIKVKVNITNTSNNIEFKFNLLDVPDSIEKFVLEHLFNGIKNSFKLNAYNPILGGNMALYIGSPPQKVPFSQSYILPNHSHIFNLVKNEVNKNGQELLKLGLVYKEKENYLTIVKPLSYKNQTIEFQNSKISFPNLVVEEERLLLSDSIQFDGITLKNGESEQTFSKGTIDCILPVNFVNNPKYLGLELANREGEAKFLASSNIPLDIMANMFSLAYLEKLKEAIHKIKIPREKLQIKVKFMEKQTRIFEILHPSIVGKNLFLLYQCKK